MPLYDFQCTKCEHVFEDMAPSDGPFPPCPECNEPTERLISPPNFSVKTRSEKSAMKQKQAHAEWKSEQKPTFAVSNPPKKVKGTIKKF